MSQDPDQLPSEATLRGALQAGRPPDIAPSSERLDRIQKAVRGQTAARDVSHFVLGSVFAALGRLLLTLWNLATGSIDSSKNNPNPQLKERDEDQS